MSRQKYDLAPGQFSGKELVRRAAKGRFDRDPLLSAKPVYMIQAAAANNADAVLRHGALLYHRLKIALG